MRIFGGLALVLIVVAAIAALLATFTVRETEQVLVLRLGEPVGAVNAPGNEDPGLHFKTPFLDEVVVYDKRNIEFDMAPEEIQAADQERLVVDSFLRYRIVDPLRFYQTVRNEIGARARLRSIMDDSLRGVIASIPSQDVISGQRAELMDRVQSAVEAQVANQNLGIEVIDVRILRADLPQQIADRVFERMRSERQQEAARIRAEGEQAAQEIRADADRQATVIRAEARADAERIRGEGDARRNNIYAEAFGRDEEFFRFYRSMLAYESAFREGTPIVIEAEVVLVSKKSRATDELRWVYLDIGKFGGLAETMDESIRYPIRTDRDADETAPCVLAGPTCDSADVMYERTPYPLPVSLSIGDKVLIEGTGAYTTTYAAVAFNGFPPLKSYVI